MTSLTEEECILSPSIFKLEIRSFSASVTLEFTEARDSYSELFQKEPIPDDCDLTDIYFYLYSLFSRTEFNYVYLFSK